jgi:hypothetical protein
VAVPGYPVAVPGWRVAVPGWRVAVPGYPVMESLSNILAAAVLRKAGGDEQKQAGPASWEAGYNALVRLFCGDYAKTATKYSDKVIGPGALEEVMKIGFDVDGEPSGNLRAAITNYLKNQGGIIKQMNYGGKMTNSYTLVGFSNFVSSSTRRCCFTAYFTTLDAQTSKIGKTCEDDKMQFDFDFEITRCNANFMLANWETNPAFRQRVADFIATHPVHDDYFNSFETGMKFRVPD